MFVVLKPVSSILQGTNNPKHSEAIDNFRTIPFVSMWNESIAKDIAREVLHEKGVLRPTVVAFCDKSQLSSVLSNIKSSIQTGVLRDVALSSGALSFKKLTAGTIAVCHQSKQGYLYFKGSWEEL